LSRHTPRWQAPCLALGLHALVLAAVWAGSGHDTRPRPAVSAWLVSSGPTAATPPAKPALPLLAQHHGPAHPQRSPAPAPALPALASLAVATPPTASPPGPAIAVTPAGGAEENSSSAAARPAVVAAPVANNADTIVYDASYRHKPEPDYPWMARRLNQEGTANVAVQVGSDGQARSVRLIKSSGFSTLDEAAQLALKHCSDCFVPPQRDGQPVSGWALVPMVFRLQG
jgi:protein TonB